VAPAPACYVPHSLLDAAEDEQSRPPTWPAARHISKMSHVTGGRNESDGQLKSIDSAEKRPYWAKNNQSTSFALHNDRKEQSLKAQMLQNRWQKFETLPPLIRIQEHAAVSSQGH